MLTGNRWVKNGDTWTITAISRDGSLTARRANGAGTAVLPAGYVREHLELGYASTTHKAQGRTLDTAHAYICPDNHRELLYVMTTRGREANHLYVDTSHDPDPDTQHAPSEAASPLDVLGRVLDNEGRDRSATEVRRTEYSEQYGLKQLWAEYHTIASIALAGRYSTLLAQAGLTAEQHAAVTAADTYGALTAAFCEAETRRLDLANLLSTLIRARPLHDADDIAAVLHHRLDRWIDATSRPAAEDRIAGLFPRATGIADPEMRQALLEREHLIQATALDLGTRAIQNQEPWLQDLGQAPTDPDGYRDWLNAVTTTAAYRDYWQTNNGQASGLAAPTAEQQTHLQAAMRARPHQQEDQTAREHPKPPETSPSPRDVSRSASIT